MHALKLKGHRGLEACRMESTSDQQHVALASIIRPAIR
jgi:hypothetical protein